MLYVMNSYIHFRYYLESAISSFESHMCCQNQIKEYSAILINHHPLCAMVEMGGILYEYIHDQSIRMY